MKLTDAQFKLLKAISERPLCYSGPCYRGEAKLWKTLTDLGLIKRVTADEGRWKRQGHMGGNTWTELTPAGKELLEAGQRERDIAAWKKEGKRLGML